MSGPFFARLRYISVRLCDFSAARALGLEWLQLVKHVLGKQVSQQSTKKQKRYTNFSDTYKIGRNTTVIVTMHRLVKIEGEAKIGTAYLGR